MDLLDKVMGEMKSSDSSRSSKPSDSRSSASTSGSAWNRTRGPPGKITSRAPSDDVKPDLKPPRFPSSSTPSSSTPLSFGRIPKREKTSDSVEPLAKRKPSDGALMQKDSFQAYSKAHVQLNMFNVDISNMDERVQRILFKVHLIQADGSEFELNDGTVAFGGDVNRQTCRRSLFVLFENWFRQNSHFFNNSKSSAVAAFDCANTFYVGMSNYSGGIEEHVCEMTSEGFSREDWLVVNRLSRKKNPKFLIRVKAIGEVWTRGKAALTDENRPELTRLIETVTSQILNDGNFLLYSSGVYPTDERSSLSNPDGVVEIRSGFSKTFRVLEGPDGNPHVSLTLDTASSAFYKATSLLAFIVAKLNDLQGGGGDGGRGGHGGNRRGNDRRGNDRHGDRRGGDRHGDRHDNYRRDDRRGENRSEHINDVDQSAVRDFESKYVERRIAKSMVDDIGRAMKGLVTQATHLNTLGSNRAIIVDGFCKANAIETEFDWQHDGVSECISVRDYYRKHYSYELRYPQLPLITAKKRNHAEYFPAELLVIMPGQRVKASQMTVAIQSHMTGKNSTLPKQHIQQHQYILDDSLKFNSQNQFISAFRIALKSKEPVKITAKILAPALIKFNAQNYQPVPEQGVRFAKNSKFVKPAVIRRIAMLNTDGRFSNDLPKFKSQLNTYCREQGIQIEQDPRDWREMSAHPNDITAVKDFMIDCIKAKIDIIFAICADKKPETHDVLKYYEEKLGMLTMQISTGTATKILSGGRSTVDNIIRKLNAKCGGTNFFIDVPQSVNGTLVCSKQDDMRKKLFATTQFVGLEMSHAGARTNFDKKTSIVDGDPTVVGISYSLKNSTQLGGFSYYQATRETKIQNLDTQFVKVVNNYKKSVGRLPETIVVYRTGASEGELPRVQAEVMEIQQSFGAVASGYRPKLVVVLAQRRSHVRIFPENIKNGGSSEQNVTSGTAIDRILSTSGLEEFILVSQIPLIGTVHPTRYTIVTNTAGWSTNEVLHVTYFLAFGHQVSYQPPSVPDVLYAAENLAKRGHNNYKTFEKLDKIQWHTEGVFKYGNVPEEEKANEDKYLDILIGKISDSINGMTISGRNFWA